MLVNMTKRGSLAACGYGGALVPRRKLTLSYLSPLVSYTTSVGGYALSLAKGFPRAGLSGIEEIGTVNCIGYKVYVDHGKTKSGDGLSWETAYANLNDLLNDPLLYYTCVSQRQVVHAYVRGEVNYPIHTTSLGARNGVLEYCGYLVIHDCTFYYDLRVDSSSLCATAGNSTLSCISVSGLVFHSCHFTVIQPDGIKGTDGVDNENGASGTDGGDGGGSLTKGVYLGETESADRPMYSTEVALVYGDCAYFYKCTFDFTCGNGGDGGKGGKGATAYAASSSRGGDGGNGGNGGQIHIMKSGACALHTCAYTVNVGSSGNGGAGGDAYIAGDGREAAAAYSITILPYTSAKLKSKAFGCTFIINSAPVQHGGNGGQGALAGGRGGKGGSCNVTLEIKAYGNVNECTFTVLQDLTQCSSGEGGEHTYTQDNGTTIDAAGDSGSMQSSLTFKGGRIKNSHIQLNIPHNGQGGEVHGCKVYVYLDAAFATTIGIHNACKYTPLTRIRNSAFELHIPEFSITIPQASNVDVAITQGNIDQLPDGVRQDKYVDDDGTVSYAYQKGGCILGRNWLSVSASKYATELSATQDYGLSVTVQKPGGVTCGYPSGGISGNAFGYIVHGRDGRASWNNVVSIGGNGSAAFTWMNWSAPAGTFGHGKVDDPSYDGSLLTFAGKDYNSDIVDISFV